MKNHFERFGAASQAISPLGSTVTSAPCGASARRRSASSFASSSVARADEQVLPAARERGPLRLELLRKRDRLGVAGQVDPHLPLGVAGGGRVGRVLRLRLVALRLPLRLGVGQRLVAGLPLLGERVPAVERERRRHVLLARGSSARRRAPARPPRACRRRGRAAARRRRRRSRRRASSRVSSSISCSSSFAPSPCPEPFSSSTVTLQSSAIGLPERRPADRLGDLRLPPGERRLAGEREGQEPFADAAKRGDRLVGASRSARRRSRAPAPGSCRAVPGPAS